MKYSPEIIWREISKSIQRWRPNNKVILKLIANGRCKRRKLLEAGMALVLSRRRLQIQAFLLAAMLLVSQNTSTVYHRSCRRLAPQPTRFAMIHPSFSKTRDAFFALRRHDCNFARASRKRKGHICACSVRILR